MKKHYKNIEEALKVERPDDKVVKILSNKFAIIKSKFTNGTYDRQTIAGINGGTTVYHISSVENVKRWIKHVLSLPNTQKTQWCLNHSANGKKYHYVFKTSDNRKWKQNMRRLNKLI